MKTKYELKLSTSCLDETGKEISEGTLSLQGSLDLEKTLEGIEKLTPVMEKLFELFMGSNKPGQRERARPQRLQPVPAVRRPP